MQDGSLQRHNIRLTQSPPMQPFSDCFFQEEKSSSVWKVGESHLSSVSVITTTSTHPHPHHGTPHYASPKVGHYRLLSQWLSICPEAKSHLTQPGICVKKIEPWVPLETSWVRISRCQEPLGFLLLGSFRQDALSCHHPRKQILFTAFKEESKWFVQSC